MYGGSVLSHVLLKEWQQLVAWLHAKHFKLEWTDQSVSEWRDIVNEPLSKTTIRLPSGHARHPRPIHDNYTPATKLGGYIGFTLSVCPSVRPSVCPLTFRVRPGASTVQDGFFPYLVQMINSTRGWVACHDIWPWLIPSRSFGLDLENRVRSVASTVLDGFFLYLAQMITIIRGCVTCYVFFRIWKFEFLANF